MPTILDLPAPVRHRIFTHVLVSCLDEPQSLGELHSNDAREKVQRTFRLSANINESAIEKIIKYPFTIYLPFSGLLRTSSQIRKEVKQCMQELKRKKLHYKLDLVVEDELQMLPSWLKCPARNMEIQRLEIDIRLLGFVNDDPFQTLDGLQQHARDRCRTLAFAIVALVSRFIERGPRFEHLRQGNIQVHSLMLNFQSRRENLEPHQLQLGRANSIEEERGLMDHLTLSGRHHHSEHAKEGFEKHDSVHDGEAGRRSSSPGGASISTTGSRDPNEVVDAEDLLRTVDLVLRPLCRQEKYTLESRRKHFSAEHLAFLRSNLSKIYLVKDGVLQKAMAVEN